jgi:CubicO group peptidase (beta-lactamase class C family)
MKHSKIIWYFILLVIIISIAGACKKESDNPPGHNADTLAPALTIDTAMISDAFLRVQQISNILSLVVCHDDTIIKEAYFGTGGAGVALDVRSVTKSITALLAGIAIDKGFIQITAPNQVQYVLDKPLIAQPGEIFTYNSGAFHLLSVIISRATGIQTLEFANQNLFEPLGIGDKIWEVDHQGYNNGAAGLKITPHDMVKIGQLMLHHGEYNGKWIVSSLWIERLISFKIITNKAVPYGSGYGHGWWNGQSEQGNYAFAMGWGGQFIITVPNLKLIVVATNKWSGVSGPVANEQWYRTIDLIMIGILPAFTGTGRIYPLTKQSYHSANTD